MNWIDFGIAFVVVLIMISIIIFFFVLPIIKHKKPCDSCSSPKKIQRALKKYRKQNKK